MQHFLVLFSLLKNLDDLCKKHCVRKPVSIFSGFSASNLLRCWAYRRALSRFSPPPEATPLIVVHLSISRPSMASPLRLKTWSEAWVSSSPHPSIQKLLITEPHLNAKYELKATRDLNSLHQLTLCVCVSVCVFGLFARCLLGLWCCLKVHWKEKCDTVQLTVEFPVCNILMIQQRKSQATRIFFSSFLGRKK